MQDYLKIQSKAAPDVIMRITPGHFVTPNSHVNYYIDMTPLKCRISETEAVAKALASIHYWQTPVDSIVCLDNTEVIGGFLAHELLKAGVISMNMHKTMYVLTPEYTHEGQILFREQISSWIRGRNILLLFGTATTGTTVNRALEALMFYEAHISGISAIFSTISRIADVPVYSLFSQSDIPDYKSWAPKDCQLCKKSEKIDALVTGHGISVL